MKLTKKAKAALETLRQAGYQVSIRGRNVKGKVKAKLVQASRAFRRKGHEVQAHAVKTTKTFRIHKYWRRVAE